VLKGRADTLLRLRGCLTLASRHFLSHYQSRDPSKRRKGIVLYFYIGGL
jgi:hypothetical protein